MPKGYDIRTEDAYHEVIEEFDQIVGLEYLCGMHLNDSKTPLGSKVDRHESIGEGKIGMDAFRFIMNDMRLNDIPMILETPRPELWESEISKLYSLVDSKWLGTMTPRKQVKVDFSSQIEPNSK